MTPETNLKIILTKIGEKVVKTNDEEFFDLYIDLLRAHAEYLHTSNSQLNEIKAELILLKTTKF